MRQKKARKKEDARERYLRNGNSPKMALGLYSAITITYLRSVRLLDSIMLYLMGGTASRVWHDIRGRVNIYPVRFLKCPDLQWPLCCPPHIYCRALPTAILIHFCLAPRAPTSRCLHPTSKDSPAASRVPSIRFQSSLNDQARSHRQSNGIRQVKH